MNAEEVSDSDMSLVTEDFSDDSGNEEGRDEGAEVIFVIVVKAIVVTEDSEPVFEELEAWLALKKAQGFIKIIQDNYLLNKLNFHLI